MKIFETTSIGTYHTNHNEDFLVKCELENNRILLAVMDGCSMGQESHFASTLTGKLLRKIAKEIYFKSFIEKDDLPLADLLKNILRQLFSELKRLQHQLMLGRNELLSTLIISVIETEQRKAEILTIGDGLICYNGQMIEYDQDNVPDYLGYHLDQDFEDWFSEQEQRLSLENIIDLSISTDGIFSFEAFNNKRYPEIDSNYLIYSMLIEQGSIDSDRMLQNKLSTIEETYGLKPYDDLTILRVIF